MLQPILRSQVERVILLMRLTWQSFFNTFWRNTPSLPNTMIKEKVFTVDNGTVWRAVQLLKQGNVVALPTDTVYGLAADATCDEAVQKLYTIKGRDSNNPVAICVGQVKDIPRWGEIDDLPESLLDSLLPGPVTILLRRSPTISLNINPGVTKIGIRVPNSDFIGKVATELGSAIALTSANLSNEPSTVRVEEFQHLWPKLGGVFDAGYLGESRAGSTIIDLTNSGYFSVKRAGSALADTLTKLEKFGLKNLDRK